jgi:hypothetical protein
VIDADRAIALILLKRFSLETERANRLARRLIELAAEPWPIFETAKDRNGLEELARAVMTIERILHGGLSETAQGALSERLFFGDSVQNWTTKEQPTDLEEMLGKILTMNEFQAAGGRERLALFTLADDVRSTLTAIEETKLEVAGPAGRTKPVNRPEVQAVDAARIVWELAGRKKAPAKDLAVGSPFFDFLSDVFYALELTGQPKSAFRAWVRETAKSPDR